jgi:hypothetical protein
MQRVGVVFVMLVALVLSAAALGADDESSARSWKKQANDTRATVVSVAQDLEKTGDKGSPDARGLIADAKQFLAKGDENLAKADGEFDKKQFKEASNDYNMAWQYYVKAATAGLNAQSILAGK